MMKVVRALHSFRVDLPPLIDCNNVKLDWSGQATLAGPSGIGKTSFFRLLAGWYNSNQQTLSKCEVEPSWNPFKDVYLVGAHRSLLPWRRVIENLSLHGPDIDVWLLREYLSELNLPDNVEKLFPYELSAGMYRRVELLIGIIRNPTLLLLDEFYSSIADPQKEAVKAFINSQRKLKMTWVVAHEERLRLWIGGPQYHFVIQGGTISGVSFS